MLKNILKKILIISFELALIAGALFFIAQKKGIQKPQQIIPALEQAVNQTKEEITQEKKFPQAEQPIKKNFSWVYKNAKYTIDLTLYQSYYDFYTSQPKTYSYVGELSQNWEDEYYEMFLKQNPQDDTISALANGIQELGRQHKLSDDQIVDLTMAFVQSIPYDDARAKEILSKNGNAQIQYPYETLFRQLGVCSDKSLLATVLLRQMGYGTAIFTYQQENHMAIGIQCPKNYSTYGSGYCYAETTASGNKIGLIPTFDTASNKTLNADQLASVSASQSQQINLKQLGQVTIFQQSSGKEYNGIIQTNKIEVQIDSLKKTISDSLLSLQQQQKAIKKEQSQLESMNNELEKYKADQNIDKFNALAQKYNSLLEDYRKDLKKYNSTVALYNQAVERYNTLIKQ